MATTLLLEDLQTAAPRTTKLPSGQTVTLKFEIAIASDEIPVIDVELCKDRRPRNEDSSRRARSGRRAVGSGSFMLKGHVSRAPDLALKRH